MGDGVNYQQLLIAALQSQVANQAAIIESLLGLISEIQQQRRPPQ